MINVTLKKKTKQNKTEDDSYNVNNPLPEDSIWIQVF